MSNIQFYEYSMHQTIGHNRLRSLVIRYIPLGDVVILIGSLNMPLLEKLILIDLYDHSKLSTIFVHRLS